MEELRATRCRSSRFDVGRVCAVARAQWLVRGKVRRDLLVGLEFQLALTEEIELALTVDTDQIRDVVMIGVAGVVR